MLTEEIPNFIRSMQSRFMLLEKAFPLTEHQSLAEAGGSLLQGPLNKVQVSLYRRGELDQKILRLKQSTILWRV
jgi:hypothetical protein